ncbi:hypothetical protein H0H93_006034 [Arthromyces matolae]|nr:hypothetical protein H0H93_006034 [Arthromyces matolae]
MSAGSFKGPRKRIYATKETLNDLENVFSDRIWPNLASWDENDDDYKLLYSQLHVDNKYKEIYPGISVQTMPLNHGHNERGHYASTAFFIRHDIQNREFLFFGDVEPDVVAAEPLNINVWRAAAPKVPHKLSAIFIECSWPSGRSDDTLYGHMNPTHLVTELVALATEVIRFKKDQSLGISTRPAKKKQKRNPITDEELVGALQRLRIYVIHCKDDLTGDPAREIIVSQIRDLVEEKKLGAEIIAVEQGMYIGKHIPLTFSWS